MKAFKYIVNLFILVFVLFERFHFYTQPDPKLHLLNISLQMDRPLNELIIYDSVIVLITLIGVFSFPLISSLGLLIDSGFRMAHIYRQGLQNFKQNVDDRVAGTLIAVVLIVLSQILMAIFTKRESSSVRSVKEDKRSNPKGSNNSNNPSKRRKQKESLF